MKLNVTSKRSFATQLTDILIADLIADAERNGGRLRSYRLIAKDYHTSINTVHHAVKSLMKQGVFRTRKGSGTFLQDGYRNRIHAITVPRKLHIAVVFSDRADAYAWMNPFIDGLAAYQKRHGGYSFSVHYLRGTDIEDDANAHIHDYLMKGFCDGVILMCPVLSRNIRMMMKYHVHFVALYNDYPYRIDSIHADTERVFSGIDGVMKNEKRKRLLMIINVDLNRAKNRFSSGFASYRKAHGTYPYAVDTLVFTKNDPASLERFMKKNAAAIHSADCIFTIGDEAAMACRSYLRNVQREARTLLINYTDYNYTVADRSIPKSSRDEIMCAVDVLVDQITNPDHKYVRRIFRVHQQEAVHG